MHSTAEGFLSPYLGDHLPWLYINSGWWTVLGFIAGFTFSGRFILQWLYSEKAKKVGVMNMIYLMHVDRAPLIFANCFLPFLYGRNLYLLYKHKTIESAGDSKGE